MVLASARKGTMPISRAELAARLIHRKFWFVGLFLSVRGCWPLSIPLESEWSLLILGDVPFRAA
jgi:hypothetical protein